MLPGKYTWGAQRKETRILTTKSLPCYNFWGKNNSLDIGEIGIKLIGKDPDAGKDWRQEEKGTTEDEMIGWYHWLNGYEFEQAPEVGDGQESLACHSPWGLKE